MYASAHLLNDAEQFIFPRSLPVSPFSFDAGITLRGTAQSSAPAGTETEADSLDLVILFLVNKHLLLTAYQVYDILAALDAAPDAGYGGMFRRMDKLTERALLEKYEYSRVLSAERPDSFYKVSTSGGKLLQAHGGRHRLFGYLENLNAAKALRILAVNQMLVKRGLCMEDISIASSIFAVSGTQPNFSIRPQGILQTEERTYLLEAVRNSSDWEMDLTKKLQRYNTLFKNAPDTNIRLAEPTIVLIAESALHCRQVMDLTTDKQYRKGIPANILYTSDDLLYTTPADQSCFCRIREPRRGITAVLDFLTFGDAMEI